MGLQWQRGKCSNTRNFPTLIIPFPKGNILMKFSLAALCLILVIFLPLAGLALPRLVPESGDDVNEIVYIACGLNFLVLGLVYWWGDNSLFRWGRGLFIFGLVILMIHSLLALTFIYRHDGGRLVMGYNRNWNFRPEINNLYDL